MQSARTGKPLIHAETVVSNLAHAQVDEIRAHWGIVPTARIIYASINYLTIGSKHVVYRSIVVVAIRLAALRVWLIRALRSYRAPINEPNAVVHGWLSSILAGPGNVILASLWSFRRWQIRRNMSFIVSPQSDADTPNNIHSSLNATFEPR